ncbi:MAG: hypothetical protein JJ831_08225 [Prochlorococcus marinus XMU1422]|nr:hypothetical protein [Prochlorococcus marinus XMU1421]MBO7013286.1 hypothetical protein [Prochlorococcus marinus XMU1422]MCR8542259.1 hypothetical protein [Prochlorococcus marinus XMU1423]
MFLLKNKPFKSITFFCIFVIFTEIFSLFNKSYGEIEKDYIDKTKDKQWHIHTKFQKEKKDIKWTRLKKSEQEVILEEINNINQNNKQDKISLNSLNRSIVFNNNVVGPDISWIIPPGFRWNSKYKIDLHARGHNTRIPEPPTKRFFGWNDGDAVGLVSYQFMQRPKSSFGINVGLRSMSLGNGDHLGSKTGFGQGLSGGFRWDYELSKKSGFAFGAEQLIHFDSSTDTGRNIYLTVSKGWWSSEIENEGEFPLYVATAGMATGRMAVGTIKGLCSDLLGGAGTEAAFTNLCWSPVFSLASVWNERFSTFFEYNSRFFILGTSMTPSKKIPLRGTFGLILSDHIDNYALHDPSKMNWVFNLSLGF